jgi:hypothetical protein
MAVPDEPAGVKALAGEPHKMLRNPLVPPMIPPMARVTISVADRKDHHERRRDVDHHA